MRRRTDNSELRIYSVRSTDTAKSSNGTGFRISTLMHNPQYRCQATTKGYVQSSYTDFYLGTGMTPPPPAPMVDAKLVWRGGTGATTWDSGTTASWLDNGANSTFANGDSVRFDIGGDNTTTVALNGTLQPAAVTVYSPKDYTFDGSTGSLAGPMTLMKAGAGVADSIRQPSLHRKHHRLGRRARRERQSHAKPGHRLGRHLGRRARRRTQRAAASPAPAPSASPSPSHTAAASLPARAWAMPAPSPSPAASPRRTAPYFAIDLSNDPSGTINPSDSVAITGNLSLSGKVGLVIKPLNGTLAPGTYTLITYTGTLTGNVSNFAVTVPAGTPYTLAAAAGAVTLTVPVTRAPAAIVWRGSGGDLGSRVQPELVESRLTGRLRLRRHRHLRRHRLRQPHRHPHRRHARRRHHRQLHHQLHLHRHRLHQRHRRPDQIRHRHAHAHHRQRLHRSHHHHRRRARRRHARRRRHPRAPSARPPPPPRNFVINGGTLRLTGTADEHQPEPHPRRLRRHPRRRHRHQLHANQRRGQRHRQANENRSRHLDPRRHEHLQRRHHHRRRHDLSGRFQRQQERPRQRRRHPQQRHPHHGQRAEQRRLQLEPRSFPPAPPAASMPTAAARCTAL